MSEILPTDQKYWEGPTYEYIPGLTTLGQISGMPRSLAAEGRVEQFAESPYLARVEPIESGQRVAAPRHGMDGLLRVVLDRRIFITEEAFQESGAPHEEVARQYESDFRERVDTMAAEQLYRGPAAQMPCETILGPAIIRRDIGYFDPRMRGDRLFGVLTDSEPGNLLFFSLPRMTVSAIYSRLGRQYQVQHWRIAEASLLRPVHEAPDDFSGRPMRRIRRLAGHLALTRPVANWS